MYKKYLVLIFHGFKTEEQYIHLQTPILYWLWTDEIVTCCWNLWKLLSFALCNNLRVTLGNSVDIEGLPCQTLFISFSLWEKWTGSLQNFKGKSSFSARKNHLCVQVLCCELLFVDMQALPCKFLIQQMKWILFHADFANSSWKGKHISFLISDHHNKCKDSVMWRDTVSTKMSTCNNVTSIVYDLYGFFLHTQFMDVSGWLDFPKLNGTSGIRKARKLLCWWGPKNISSVHNGAVLHRAQAQALKALGGWLLLPLSKHTTLLILKCGYSAQVLRLSTISFIKQRDCPARMFPDRLFWDTAKRATQPYGAKIVLQPEIIWLFSESWGQTYIFWGAQSLFLMWKHLTERHNDSLYSPFPPTKGVIHKFISCSFFI